jgi:prepilin-type N-terminal cleavage/methylation domain-containing protein/prepilin-type processing-associated H-X9-DG protein
MNRHAFTLIELLVVISLIGMLAALLLPGISAVRTQAKTLSCQSRLRQVGLCFLNYSIDNRGGLPWGYGPAGGWNVWYKAITGTNTETGGIDSYNSSGASEWGSSFFCTEDTNRPTNDSSTIGFSPGSILWDVYAVSHGYNSHGLGGTGFTSYWGRSEYLRPARLNEINDSSQTVLSGDTKSFLPGRLKVGAGHALVADDSTTASVLYPRHKERIANVLWVDGHVSGMAAKGRGNYASFYDVTQLGLLSRDRWIDNMWDRK